MGIHSIAILERTNDEARLASDGTARATEPAELASGMDSPRAETVSWHLAATTVGSHSGYCVLGLGYG